MSTVCDSSMTLVHLARKVRFDRVNEFDAEMPYINQPGPTKTGPSSAFTFRARVSIDTGLNSSPLFNMIAHITHKPNDPYASFRFFRPTHAHGQIPELKDGFSNLTMTMTFIGQDGTEKFARNYSSTMDYCGKDCSCRRDSLENCHKSPCFAPIELILDSIWTNQLSTDNVFAYLFAFLEIRLVGRNSNSNSSTLDPLNTSSLSKAMKKLLEASTLYDVTLKVNGQEFRAHMNILAGHSDVFEAMFESDMKERNSRVVEINDLTPATVAILLKYVYYRDLREIQENTRVAVDLLRAADKYNIKCLQQTCENILEAMPSEKFTISTALDLYLIGHRLCLANVERHAVRVLKSKSKEFKESDIFKRFLEGNIDVLPNLFFLLAIEEEN